MNRIISIENKFIALFAALAIVFGLHSCTEPYPLELPEDSEQILIVEGNITSCATKQWIKLSSSSSYFKDVPPPAVNKAKVEIFEVDTTQYPADTSAHYLLEEFEQSGVYYTQTEVAGKINHKYLLQIQLSNGEKYSAQSHLKPLLITKDSISVTYAKSLSPFDTAHYYIVKYFAKEDEQKEQAYWWNLYLDKKLDSDTLRETHFENDKIVNGNYIRDLEIFYIKTEKIQSDSVMATVELRSIPNNQHYFFQYIMIETDWRGSLFDSPPSNIDGNISNGAMGYFGAHDVKYYNFWIKREH